MSGISNISRALKSRWDDQRKGHWLLLLLSVFIAYLFYWPIYLYLNAPSDVPRDQIITQFDVAEIAVPTLEAAEEGAYETVEAFWRTQIDTPQYLAFRSQLTLSHVPDYDVGIGGAFFVDNYNLYVNGFLVSSAGKIEYPSTYHGKRREIVRVSRGLLRPGNNEILAIAVQNEAPDIAVSAMLVGDYEKIMQATARKRFMFDEYKSITIIVAGLIAALCFILLPRTQRKALPIWLGLLAAAIALRVLYSLYFGRLGGGASRAFLYHAVTLSIPMAWLGFVNAWCDNRNISLVLRTGLCLFALLLLITGLLTFTALDSTGQMTRTLTDWGGLFLIFAALGVLVCHVYKNEERRVWEFGVIALGLTLTLMDMSTFVLAKSDYGHSNIIGLIILLGLIGGILSRSIRVFESLGSLNRELQDRLAIREEEIKRKFSELEEVRRQRDIANERQRILRDMHDGIGAQLVVLLSAARSGELKPDALERAISQSLTDLRLMIDSLDSVSSDLAVALGTFRMRILPHLEAAGYTFHWNLDGLPIGVDVSPKIVLNIYRILQEAIANIIRHAEASRISITVTPSRSARDDMSFDVEIRDNGKGMIGTPKRKGRGLSSMQKRAEEIGASLSFDNSDDGLTVRILSITPRSQDKNIYKDNASVS